MYKKNVKSKIFFWTLDNFLTNFNLALLLVKVWLNSNRIQGLSLLQSGVLCNFVAIFYRIYTGMVPCIFCGCGRSWIIGKNLEKLGKKSSAAEGRANFFRVSSKFSSFFSKLFKIYNPHQKSNFEQKVLFWSADVWMEILENLPRAKAAQNFFSVFSKFSFFSQFFQDLPPPPKIKFFWSADVWMEILENC